MTTTRELKIHLSGWWHRAAAHRSSRRNRWRWSLYRWLKGRHQPVVLVGLMSHLGDIVAAQPVVAHLRAAHPTARLVWATQRPYVELVASQPGIDGVLSLACLTQWIHLTRHPIADRVVDLHLSGRYCPTCYHKVRRAIHPGVDTGNYYSQGNLLSAFCRSAGLPVLKEGPRLILPERVRRRVDRLELPERFVVVHGRSQQRERDWRPKAWRSLVQSLNERGHQTAEIGLQREIVGPTGPKHRDLTGRLSILESAEVIRRARLFVGVDSGPAHLANAVDTPGVVLLGRYRGFDRYVPYSGSYADGSRAVLLYAKAAASSLPVDRVMNAVLASLEETTPCRMTPW